MASAELHEALRENKPGVWVNAAPDGEALPAEDELRFIVRGTVEHLWRLAIIGYNAGHEIDVLSVGGDKRLFIKLPGSYYPLEDAYPAVEDPHEPIIPVQGLQLAAYRNAVTKKRAGPELLVDVLEQERFGVWELESPNPAGHALVDRFYYNHSGGGEISYRHRRWQSEETYYSKPTPVKLLQTGPEFYFETELPRLKDLRVSSLAGRTTLTPVTAQPYVAEETSL